MNADINGMKEVADPILKAANSKLNKSLKLIDEIILDVSKLETQIDYRKKLNRIKSNIENTYDTISEVKKWVRNKADKLQQADDTLKNVMENSGEATIISEEEYKKSKKMLKASNLIEALNDKEKYFSNEILQEAMKNMYICKSDEKFERIYKESGKVTDVSKIGAFIYNGKLYIRKDANVHTIMNVVNQFIGITIRNQKNKNKTKNKKSKIVSNKGINRSLAEYATRIADSTLTNSEKRQKEVVYERRYDYSVNYLKFLQNNLNKAGFKNLVVQTSYNTKSQLRKTIKSITGNDDFYVEMVNSLYIITEKPNATEQEIKNAQDKLASMKQLFKNKCEEYKNGGSTSTTSKTSKNTSSKTTKKTTATSTNSQKTKKETSGKKTKNTTSKKNQPSIALEHEETTVNTTLNSTVNELLDKLPNELSDEPLNQIPRI